MVNKLHAKKVFIVDDQESYSTGLAAAATRVLKANGVKVDRESVNQKVTDFSSLVTKIAERHDGRLPAVAGRRERPALLPSRCGSRARRRRSSARTASTRVTSRSTGAYVSSFARDIHGLPGTAKVIAATTRSTARNWSTFGPPAYVAMQVLATAYKAACADGKATRAEVLGRSRRSRSRTDPRVPLTFDKHGDVPAAKFYVYQIQSNGKHKLVG